MSHAPAPRVSELILRSPALRRVYGVRMWVPSDASREHLQLLKSAPYYMSNARIAEISGLSESNLCQIQRGMRHACRDFEVVDEVHRDTEETILGVKPEIADLPRGMGGHVPPTGARRRLQALVYAGYPMRYLAEELEWGVGPQSVHRFISGRSGLQFVMAATHRAVVDLYDRLEVKQPSPPEFTKYMIGCASKAARRNGYVPAHCWDPSTIDDPDAVPDWTGRCGTALGTRIHRREDIPMCDACSKFEFDPKLPGFNGERFRKLRERRGVSRNELAQAVRMNESTIIYWEQGRSFPMREFKIDATLSYLDGTFEDVYDGLEEWDGKSARKSRRGRTKS